MTEQVKQQPSKLVETKVNKPKKPEPKEIKLIGMARNLNHDGFDYYVGFDGTQYYIFTGSIVSEITDPFQYDDWDGCF